MAAEVYAGEYISGNDSAESYIWDY
jgi:hypothetical protein